MSFLWPEMLWLLLAAPALIGLYWLALRRKKRVALRYANLSLVKEAMETGIGYRRHIPAILFLLAVIVMLLSVARPTAIITLPSQRSTVILALDTSGSMRAADVNPNRITGAQEAAKSFIKEQPRDVRIGVVAFAASALLVQAPTFNRDDALKAVDNFELQRGTNIGGGILVGLKTLFPDGDFEIAPAAGGFGGFGGGFGGFSRQQQGTPLGLPPGAEKKAFTPVPPGSNTTAVIILLSDGQATTGPDPVEAARKAAERGVRVFTVGLGSTEGSITSFGGFSMRVQLDEDTLKKVADMTRGSYFRATTSSELNTIYKTLNTQLILETKETEITVFFSAAAMILALLAAGLSLIWFNRLL